MPKVMYKLSTSSGLKENLSRFLFGPISRSPPASSDQEHKGMAVYLSILHLFPSWLDLRYFFFGTLEFVFLKNWLLFCYSWLWSMYSTVKSS